MGSDWMKRHSLYSRSAFFFGTNPNFYRSRDGVEAYFEGLPQWQSPTVQFTDVRTAHAAAELVNVAQARRPLPSRREPSRWW